VINLASEKYENFLSKEGIACIFHPYYVKNKESRTKIKQEHDALKNKNRD
jgi:hypothetical protein